MTRSVAARALCVRVLDEVGYAIRRLGQSIILLVLVSMITGFAVLHLAPGGPLAQFAMSPGMSVAQMQKIAHQMGLDQPLPVQALRGVGRPHPRR